MSVNLNENQSKAAYYDGDKYLVIEAGPGAGKTRVLIERIKFLVNVKKVDPSTLLVITFTRKAADELKERLTKDIEESYVNLMQISTIHAFCRVILSNIGEYNTRVLGDSVNEKLKMFLNRYKKELGFDNECSIRQNEIFNLIDKYDEYATFKVNTEKLIKYITDHCEVSPEYIDFVNKYMAENDGEFPFKEVKQNDLYKKSRDNALYLQIAKSYPKYLELLEEKGFSDFPQMQIKTLDYLSEHPETIYKNILVDEFQDTDPVQMKIFEILMKHADSFTVVGDIDQSIYGFRGANKNYFEYLYNNYDDKVYKVNLNVNYRSANQIIDISEDFIKSQRAIGAKQDKAIGDRNLDRDTYFLVNEKSEDEAKSLFDMICYLHDSGKIENYNEVAILSRSIKYSNTAKEFIKLCIDNDVPYHVRGVPDLFDRPEVRSILTLIYHLIQDEDPHNHKFHWWELEWLNLKAYTGENFNQVLFDLSDETKGILNRLQDEFERKVIEEEKKAYLVVRGKISRKYSFVRIFERDEKVLRELFKHVERPILTNENLIRYGVKNKKDLEFFRKLNDLKDYIRSKEYYDSDDTILDILIKLLTDVCNILTEDFINDPNNREELDNLAIISNTFQNYELIVNNKDLNGVFQFLKFNISAYSTNKDESEGIQLMTVHKSKGLEFPVVILLSLNETRFPKEYKEKHERFFTPNSCLDYKNFDSKEEEIKEYDEEEERIVYVAMTRAQDILVLSNLIKKTPALEELKDELKVNLSEIEKREIIMDIPKGNIKIHDLINRNLNRCKFLEEDFTNIPKTICEKPSVKKEDFLNLSFRALEDYIECPFKYKLVHEINFSESTMEFNKLNGLFLHNLLETINNRIKANNNQYIGDGEVLEIVDRFKDSFRFENLRLSISDFNKIKNNILYYYNTFGKDLMVLNTEQEFNIRKEFYLLSGIIDLIYETKDGKIGIIDYKNTEHISEHFIKNYIKQLYIYLIGLHNSFKIDELNIYAIKARKMIHVNLEQNSLDILLDELNVVSENIKKEVFECNVNEDCVNCSFSKICIHINDGVSVFDFNKENVLGFRNKFYENLPEYEIIDLKDQYWADIEFEEEIFESSESDIVADNGNVSCDLNESDIEEIVDDLSVLELKNDDLDSYLDGNLTNSTYKSEIFSSFDSIYKKYYSFLDNEKDIGSINLLEYDEKLSEEENIIRKYVLILKGTYYFDDEMYAEAKDYYKKLMNNSYFKDDYYPYKRLIITCHKLKDYKDEADVIRDLFSSNIYCDKYQFLYFKYRNKRLPKKARIKNKELEELIKNYKNVIENHSGNFLIPNAERIMRVDEGIEILSGSEVFYGNNNQFFMGLAGGLYDDKLNQEAFDLYSMVIYKNNERSFRNYQRLASIYRRTKNYKQELMVILEYFNKKSKIRRTKNSDRWFNERLESTIELIDNEKIVQEIKDIPFKKAYNLNDDYELKYLRNNLDEDFKLKNLEKELKYDLESNEDIFSVFKKIKKQ